MGWASVHAAAVAEEGSGGTGTLTICAHGPGLDCGCHGQCCCVRWMAWITEQRHDRSHSWQLHGIDLLVVKSRVEPTERSRLDLKNAHRAIDRCETNVARGT